MDAREDVADASVDVDAFVDDSDVEDVDSGLGDGEAGVDAAVSCPCPADDACSSWVCAFGNVCERMLADDGTECGDARICVDGGCAVRGCGDGFLEPGPSPVAERCDDGNAVGADGCSAACVPEVRAVASGAEVDAHVADGSQAIGIDGAGRALIVWSSDEYSPLRVRLLGRRYRANGALEPSDGMPRVIDANLIASPPVATPAVVGLPLGGFVIAWTASRSGTYDIVIRMMSPDGSLGAERIANQGRLGAQKRPALIALPDGFVVAWESAHSSVTDPDGGVYARRFDLSGIPVSNDFALMSANAGIQSDVSLAVRGSNWLAVWTDQQLENDYAPALRMRRFTGHAPSDFSQRAPFSPLSSEAHAIPSGEGYVVAYRTTHMDASGDVEQLFVPESGEPTALAVAVRNESGVAERAPVITALGDGYVVGLSTQAEQVTLISDATALPVEWMTLVDALASTSATRLALARSPYGLWVVWQSNGFLGGGYGAAAWFWPSP